MTRFAGILVSDAVAAELAGPLHKIMHELASPRSGALSFTPASWTFHDECQVARRRWDPDGRPDASGTVDGTSGKVGARGRQPQLVVGVRSASKVTGVPTATLHDWCAKGRFPHRRDERGRFVFLESNLKEAKRDRQRKARNG